MLEPGVSRRVFLGSVAAAPLAAFAAGEWIDLFDGRTMQGWRPSEHKSSWTVRDGTLSADGPRSHLFYDGPVRGADFRNFELDVELVTRPECNSGIYFHTAYQESGFPEKGFEVQINNTALGDNGYLERKKTGSLYGLRNMYQQLVPDEKPFAVRIAVRGKNVQIRINSQLVVDYVEPTPAVIPEGGEKQRFLDHGTFALQCHNDGSKAFYRKVRVRPLPDDLPAYTGAEPQPPVDDVYRAIINIGRHNVPMVDYHVTLRAGLTLDDALRKSRRDGLQYGITTSSTALKSEADVERCLAPLDGRPVFSSLYAADPGWRHTLTRKAAGRFDSVVADSLTWIDPAGKPLPLASPEAGAITDRTAFMDSLLAQTVERLHSEPIDLYSRATFLPEAMRAEADQLWTDERIDRLISALKSNQVAVELNSLDRLPGRRFVDRAKQADVKFGFGTGNRTAAELRRYEYGLEMVETCRLDWRNFYAPGSWGPRAVERRW